MNLRRLWFNFLPVLFLFVNLSAGDLTVQGFFGQVRSITANEENVCVCNAELQIYSFDGKEIGVVTADKTGFYQAHVPEYGVYYITVKGIYNIEKYPYKDGDRIGMTNREVFGHSGTKHVKRGDWVQLDIQAGLTPKPTF